MVIEIWDLQVLQMIRNIIMTFSIYSAVVKLRIISLLPIYAL